MNESIRGSLIVIILCMMIALLVWGLSSPPTTIGLPAFTHAEPLPLDVDTHPGERFFVVEKATV
ncbi:hypothetical protein [Exiguobacterium sp. s193]|uniref:hypothetical protein n=1 Tax=Exiguobacterium sp. s193 TaxID=2751207 RepID=UPI001BE60D7D|nr:hypothetical protein [Exiguobacterium sp. s193]